MQPENLSIQIKNLRTRLNLSQHRFGKKVGISGKAVSSYETGRATPSVKILEQISKVYQISLITTPYASGSDLFSKVRELQDKLNSLSEELNSSIILK